ncbi:MAG: hypothetical protein LBH20_04485 [Treponema sp.]|jgi:hypothetical protein|nr:hypothetical protein [Treponema sp.]
MLAVKGRYDGVAVVLDSIPNFVELGTPLKKCEVIVTFLETPVSAIPGDDDSLDFLFKDYTDDCIREPIVNFGRAVGNEQW